MTKRDTMIELLKELDSLNRQARGFDEPLTETTYKYSSLKDIRSLLAEATETAKRNSDTAWNLCLDLETKINESLAVLEPRLRLSGMATREQIIAALDELDKLPDLEVEVRDLPTYKDIGYSVTETTGTLLTCVKEEVTYNQLMLNRMNTARCVFEKRIALAESLLHVLEAKPE